MASLDLKLLISAVDEASWPLQKLSGSFSSFYENHKADLAILNQGFSHLKDALWGVLSEWISSAREAEWQYNRLNQILKTSRWATDEQVKGLESYAESLAQVWVASKGNILTLQSQLATFDLEIDSIKALTKATVDFVVSEKWAMASAEDYKSLSNSLAQALNGNFWSLTKMWFVLDENTKSMITNGTELERANAIAEVLNSTYEGMNESVAKTSEWIQVLKDRALWDLKQTIAESVLPVIDKFNQMLIPILQSTAQWIQENPKLMQTLIAIAWVITGILGMLIALPQIMGWISTIKQLVTVLWATIWTLSAPVLIIIGVLTALFVAWQTNFLWIQDITDKIWKKHLQPIFDEFVEEWIPLIIGALQTLWEIFQEIFTAIWWFLKPIVETIARFIVDNWDTIRAMTEGIFKAIASFIEMTLGTLIGIIKAILQAFNGDWAGAWETLKQVWEDFWNAYVEYCTQLGEVLKNLLFLLWEAIKGIFTKAWEYLKIAVKSGLNFIINTINGVKNTVQNAFKWLWNGLTEFVGNIFDRIVWRIKGMVNSAISLINDAIDLANKVPGVDIWHIPTLDGARAEGWPVRSWGAYLVGERWPEIFTPSRSWYIVPNHELGGWSPTININIWGVSVRNESDMNLLVDKIRYALTQELKMKRDFGIV